MRSPSLDTVRRGMRSHGAGALGAEGWHTPRRAGYSASPDRHHAVQTLVWADTIPNYIRAISPRLPHLESPPARLRRVRGAAARSCHCLWGERQGHQGQRCVICDMILYTLHVTIIPSGVNFCPTRPVPPQCQGFSKSEISENGFPRKGQLGGRRAFQK